MNGQKGNADELRELLAVALDGELTDGQLDRLAGLLDADPAARDLYARHTTLHAHLERLHVGKERLPVRPDGSPARSPILGFLGEVSDVINWHVHPVRFFTFAALLTLVAWIGFYFYIRPALLAERQVAVRHGEAPRPFAAKLRGTVGAEWEGGAAAAPIVGSHLEQGRTLTLHAGLAELRFKSGADVILEGPCQFTLDGVNAGRLEEGKLAARVPKQATGLAVETPFATVTDLGTEFGLEVGDELAQVAVYDGEVLMEVTDTSGRKKAVRVTKGGTAKADRAGKLTTSSDGAERFEVARNMPPPAAGSSPSGLVVHYDCEDADGQLVDRAGGRSASEHGAGHLYRRPGAPAGSYGAITLTKSLGSAVGISGSNNGAWRLSPTESAELNNLTNNFTVMAWVYIPAGGFSGEIKTVIGDDLAWDGDAWGFGVRDKRGIHNAIHFTGNDVKGWLSPNGTLTPGCWQHIAVTKSARTGVTFYHNGVPLPPQDGARQYDTLVAGDDVFGLGRANATAENAVNKGLLMDEVRVYGAVLNAEGIIAAAGGGVPARAPAPEAEVPEKR